MYCIMRTEKRKKSDVGGIQQENNRTADNYNNRVELGMDVLNVQLIHSNNWMRDIQREIDTAGARARSNSVVALDTVYTASPEFFQGRTNEENDAYFKDCLRFHQKQFGHVVSAVIHYDESTPHLHIISVPLTADGRLSARDVIGNKKKMSQTQDAFFEHVGKQYGLERGQQLDGQEKKKHISAQEWELQQLKKEKQELIQELTAIKQGKSMAQERAQKARERAQALEAKEKSIEFSLIRVKGEYERLNDELKNTKAEYRHLQKQIEQLKDFLTTAERRQLREMYRRQEQEEEYEL